jgi:heterodisulfide reductase subunit B
LALSLENLSRVDRDGLSEVLVPCAACFSRFKTAQDTVRRDPDLRRELEAVLKHDLPDGVRVVHPLEVFGRGEVLERLVSMTDGRLAGLRVVCYYGCLLVRPPMTSGLDDPERPRSMDRLLGALGASVSDWGFRTECCGAFLSLTRLDIVHGLCAQILDAAKEAGADAVVTACPMCHFNLDARQGEIEREDGTRYELPILYFTQLLGLAMGIAPRELMLDKHFVDTQVIVARVANLSESREAFVP